MTEENQKRRDFLLEIESIVRETLASQPMDDDDCVRCGIALDRGIERIAAKSYERTVYDIPLPDRGFCLMCRSPLSSDRMHVLWFGPPSARPAHAVLCTHCYDFVTAPLRTPGLGAPTGRAP